MASSNPKTVTDCLFCIPVEGKVFRVIGYSDSVQLQYECAKSFAEHCNLPLDEVSIFYVTDSNRYKSMNVVWAQYTMPETKQPYTDRKYDHPPEGACVIKGDQSMMSWVR